MQVLVFRKENLVFLAVPKTGTTALEGALAPRASIVVREPADLKHSPCYRYQRFMAPYLRAGGVENLELMAVVRHPVDWLSSWYRYRSRDDLKGHRNSTRDVSFDQFVTEYCQDKPAPFANVGSQAKFLTDTDGDLGVHHLFRYEAQETLHSFLRQRLGDFPTPKRLNVSPAGQVSLSPQVADMLQKTRELEFAVWETARA